MWKVTLILNALLMALFGLSGSVSQIKLTNQFIQYPHAGEAIPPLPPISDIALRSQWLLATMPVLWALLTCLLMALYWKRDEPPRDMVQLHTSATILFGVLLLAFFVTAGILPYVSILVHMK